MNVHEYPLKLLNDLEGLYGDVRKVVAANTDLIKISSDEPFNLIIVKKNAITPVYFRILKANLLSDFKTNVAIEFSPKNRHSVEEQKTTSLHTHVIGVLQGWIGLLREYNKVRLTEEEAFIKHYEEEFFADFQIISEDADTSPFSIHQQTLLIEFLEHARDTLEKEESKGADFTELKLEADQLKGDLRNLTKNGVIKRLSNFFARTFKKGGREVLKKFWEFSLDKGFEKGTSYLIEHQDQILQKIQHFFLNNF
jgi:hypothetical protein